MPAEKVDGADFFAVYEAMGRLIDRARRGEGPSAIECTITRYYGHFEGDPQNYRAEGEVARLRETMNCIPNFRKTAVGNGWLTDADIDAVDAEVAALIDEAVDAARTAPRPTADQVTTDVYISY
jgi:pyruvate dehydrogenase E1 component alpha subunit